MFNGKLIEPLLAIRGRTRKELVRAVWGDLPPELHRSVTYFAKRKNITTDMLEKLASFFAVPMETFFLSDEKSLRKYLHNADKQAVS